MGSACRSHLWNCGSAPCRCSSWTFWTSFTSGPNPSEPQADLAALLATKGVPSQLAADREAAALKKLGHSAVRTALGQTNPWAALKALTTRPGSNFQFVLKSELQDYITSKPPPSMALQSKEIRQEEHSVFCSS